MSHSILKELQPEKQLKNIVFLKETCAQINKDLTGFTTLRIELTEALLIEPMENLIAQFIPILENLESSTSLQPFIYKVDLSEKKFLNYKLKHSSELEFLIDIIERCAQKVYLRWFFSNRLNH